MYNCNEYIEAQYGAFKIRGVPINVNYRYLDEELWYLLDNSDAEAIVFHASLGDRVAQRRRPPAEVEAADRGRRRRRRPGARSQSRTKTSIAANEPMPRIERSEDDIYMLYTGGTTGMPKGVMYDDGRADPRIQVMLRLAAARARPARRRQRLGAPMVAGVVGAGSTARVDPVRAADARHRVWLGAFDPPCWPVATSSP